MAIKLLGGFEFFIELTYKMVELVGGGIAAAAQ